MASRPESFAVTAGRATRSVDGRRRITLRIEARLDLDATSAAIAMGSNADPDGIAEAGRRRLLEWARDAVKYHGLDEIVMSPDDDYEAERGAARSRLIELGVFQEDG